MTLYRRVSNTQEVVEMEAALGIAAIISTSNTEQGRIVWYNLDTNTVVSDELAEQLEKAYQAAVFKNKVSLYRDPLAPPKPIKMFETHPSFNKG